MTIDGGLKPEGSPERSPIAGAGAPTGVDAGPKRYSGSSIASLKQSLRCDELVVASVSLTSCCAAVAILYC